MSGLWFKVVVCVRVCVYICVFVQPDRAARYPLAPLRIGSCSAAVRLFAWTLLRLLLTLLILALEDVPAASITPSCISFSSYM